MPKSHSSTVTTRIAKYMAGYGWDKLPDHIQEESQRALLNYLACTIGGATTPSVNAAILGITALDSARDIPIAGREDRFSLSNAAMLGALSASAHTFDDTHLATITHPTAPVASACLATAYKLSRSGQPVSGTRLLAAIAAGIELQCRVSNAIRGGGTAHMGWYITGLSGGVGTAVALGHLLDLDPDAMVSAIGLAATQACGLRATHGSMAIAYVPGLAARHGVDAAFLAQGGFQCSPIVLDGKNGLLDVLASSSDTSEITGSLGTKFELLNNAYKPYPCGIVIHPAIDGCLQLLEKHPITEQEIDRIVLDVHPDAMALCWRRLPETELEAQVSLFHWVAAATVFRSAGLAQGTLQAIQDDRVRSLQERIEVNIQPSLRENQAHVRMTLKDGHRVETKVHDAIGSVENPMTTLLLSEKFRTLAEPVIGVRKQETTFTAWKNLPHEKDAAILLDHMACS